MAFAVGQKVIARTRLSNGEFAVEKGARGVVTGTSGFFSTSHVVHFFGKNGEAIIGNVKGSALAAVPAGTKIGRPASGAPRRR